MAEKTISLSNLTAYNDKIKATYQAKTDNTLTTTNKTVVGAINENKTQLDTITTDLNGYKFVDAPSTNDKEINFTDDNSPDIPEVTGYEGKILAVKNDGTGVEWVEKPNGSGGVSLGETSSTAYRGDRGKTAYDHSQNPHAPETAQKNSDITKTEIETKLTGTITTHDHNYQLVLNGTDLKLMVNGVEKTTVSLASLGGGTPVTYGNIVISKTSLDITEGSTGTFTVSLDKAPTNNQVVALSKTNADVSLNATTLTFTPGNYATPQTVTITVAEDADYSNEVDTITLTSPNVSNKTITINITDNDTAPSNVLVTSITLDKTSIPMFVGNTSSINATVVPSNATVNTVSWSSSNTSIAEVVNGVVTARGVGNCTITCSANDSSGVTNTCSINVQQQLSGVDVFKYKSIPFPTATNITIPPNNLTSNDGDYDYVHPSVLYFKDGLWGKKYWMGVNPYNNTQGGYENPWLFCSDDGVTWTTPTGVTNPLMNRNAGIGNNSDIHLFYDSGTLYILNRGARSNATCQIEYISTTDGKTFSARHTILDTVDVDYVSPSICKYNGKYYMFVVDITDTVRTKLTVFEATSMDTTWTKINQINTGSEPMWHPEITYQQSTNEFLLLFSRGDAQGGSIFLGKFDTPQDTLLTICPVALVDSSYVLGTTGKGFKTCYKSSAFINENGELVLYLGTKGSSLDANTGWRVTRHVTSISIPNLANDRLLKENYNNYSMLPSTTVNGVGVLSTRSDNIGRADYLLEFNVDDISNFSVLPAVLNTTYYVRIGKQGDCIGVCEMVSGGIKNKALITETMLTGSLVSILKIGSNIKIYVDGRLGCDYTVSADLTKYKMSHYSSMIHVSNIAYYNYEDEYIPTTSAEHVSILENKILNSSSNSNIVVADNFNRANGAIGTSTNGVVWNNPNNLVISSNKAQLKQNNRLILDGVINENVKISFLSDTAIATYVSYTDSSNYKLLVMVGATINFIECVDGVETINSNKPGGLTAGGVVSAKIYSNAIEVYYNGLFKAEYSTSISLKNISFTARNLVTALLDNIVVEKI